MTIVPAYEMAAAEDQVEEIKEVREEDVENQDKTTLIWYQCLRDRPQHQAQYPHQLRNHPAQLSRLR